MYKKLFAATVLLAASLSANATIVFSDDFSPQQAGWDFVSEQADYMGQLNNSVNVPAVTLSQSFAGGLSDTTLTFDLLAFRTLDPINCCTDILSVKIDGSTVFQGAFGFGAYNPISSAVANSVTSITPTHGSTATYQISLDLGSLAAGSHDFTWSYSPLQSYADEAWGLDNVVIDAVQVPAPASALLLALGLFGLVGRRLNA